MNPIEQIQGRSILILGGNPETGALVDVANSMGLRTVVADPYPGAPAKRHAARAYDVDVKDVEAIDAIIAREAISGVLVGVADPIVRYYHDICQRHHFPCYATPRIIDALTSKANFARTCAEYGIATTPRYPVDVTSVHAADSVQFPVIVKPVDCGAGVGITVCRDAASFRQGLDEALAVSPRKEVVVERFMDCDDMFVYYTFVDGVAHLSAAADRYKTTRQPGSSPVCIGAEYPSRHLERFVERVHPKMIAMGAGLGIRDGVLMVQFFVEGDDFYAYDPGFRLQGEAPHLYLKHFHGFDHRQMLLDFAMRARMYAGDFGEVNDCRLRGACATTVWILLKPGRIGRIEGLAEIRAHAGVIAVVPRFDVGDVVTEAMAGTERQVLARIYTVAPTRAQAAANVRVINQHLRVYDADGADMVLDMHSPVPSP